MDYNSIILEMLSRIQKLEEKVKVLSEVGVVKEEKKKIETKEIREYIRKVKRKAFNNGEKFLVLVANDIHKEFNLKNRMPMVCNAMRQTMDNTKDEVLYETPSGYSSTLKIKYYPKGEE